jgi:hypothetical protein
MFLSETLTEVSIGTGKDSKSLRGRVDGKRLAEYSWTNNSSTLERIAIRAKVLAGDRDLLPGFMRFTAQQGCYVEFGHRAIPVNPDDRGGAYPHDVVVVGFILFGDA